MLLRRCDDICSWQKNPSFLNDCDFKCISTEKCLQCARTRLAKEKRENNIAKVNWPKTDYNISTEWCSFTLFTNAKTNAQNVSTWDQTNVKTIHIILVNWIKMVSNKSSTANEFAIFSLVQIKSVSFYSMLNIHKILNTIYRFLLMPNSLNAIYSWDRLKYSKNEINLWLFTKMEHFKINPRLADGDYFKPSGDFSMIFTWFSHQFMDDDDQFTSISWDHLWLIEQAIFVELNRI